MRNNAIISNEASLALPGSFMLGDTHFITGEQRDYRNLNYAPLDRMIARQALGIPTNDFMLLVKDDFKQATATIQLLPDLLNQLPSNQTGQLFFMGGELDLPDPEFCHGLASLDAYLETNRCKWKWFFTGNKPERLLKYYYSAANMVILSLNSNTEKLVELFQSLMNPLSANYMKPV